METLRIEGTLTALSMIHSGGDEKTGVESGIRTIEYIINGEKMPVPYIDGNSIRGNLRRLLLNDFFNQIGYEIKSPKIFYLLSGGVLEEVSSQSSGKLSLQLRREIQANLSPLALLGGSMGNQAFAGRLVVSHALPICKELNDFLPMQSQLSFHEFLTEAFATRRAERDVPDTVVQNPKKEEPTIQMKVTFECLAPGTRLYHKFMLEDALPIQKSCFARMLELWKERPFVGGKSAQGYGEVKIDYPKMQWTSEPYLTYLNENKEAVKQTLDRIEKI
jgi:hypothetical protein